MTATHKKLVVVHSQALMGLMSQADADEAGKAAANYLTKNERDEKIANIRKERETWKQSSLNATSKQPLDSEMTEVRFIYSFSLSKKII